MCKRTLVLEATGCAVYCNGASEGVTILISFGVDFVKFRSSLLACTPQWVEGDM